MGIAHQKIGNVNEMFGGRCPLYQVNQIYKKSGMHPMGCYVQVITRPASGAWLYNQWIYLSVKRELKPDWIDALKDMRK
ncbi:MAG: hypothetical protein HUU08_04980 [Candidatus Brocadia sp.]|nr:hypothetical protein [Candidatus Brocadia sp.]